MKIRSIGLCLKGGQPQASGVVKALVQWASERDVVVLQDEGCSEWTGVSPVSREELAGEVDLVIAMGGDGTLLSVARAAGTRPVPILGINLGTLGFLTEIKLEEALVALEKVWTDDVVIESRMRLEAVVERETESLGPYLALNDAVITKTSLSRMIDLETRADNSEVTTYHADGLIVATPTGSTAYSLSAGGPILMPSSAVVVVTPICPHSLTQRPLVLSESAELEVLVHTRGGEVTLTMDGQEGLSLLDGDRVCIRKSPYPTLLVSSPFINRFEILRSKLRWGER